MKNLTNIWKGEFGDDYSDRNVVTPENIQARYNLWFQIFASIGGVPKRILEVGAGNGQNLIAIKQVAEEIRKKMPEVKPDLYAIEPNDKSREKINKDAPDVVTFDFNAQNMNLSDGFAELVFTSGVLIHIHPDNLKKAIREIHRVSARYIVCIEYFSPNPEEIKYRDQEGLLFKRDFGGFYLDNYKMRVINYGFCWKRLTGLDDLNWWVLEKAEKMH